jgi:hypothetical protein
MRSQQQVLCNYNNKSYTITTTSFMNILGHSFRIEKLIFSLKYIKFNSLI